MSQGIVCEEHPRGGGRGQKEVQGKESIAQVLLHSRQQQFVQDHTECWVLS